MPLSRQVMEAAASSPGLSPCRVVVLDKVTDLLLLFGKLLVVGGVGKDQAGLPAPGRGAGKGELAPRVTLTRTSGRGPVLLFLHGSPRGAGQGL